MANITNYTNLITSEHQDKSNYIATIQSSCQPATDLLSLYEIIPQLYDLDKAIGVQLDVVGQWAGLTRQLTQAIDNVYFTLDSTVIGFDSGVWIGPYDPVTGLVTLPDDFYRLLIKMKVLNNYWDGSIETAYSLSSVLFSPLGYEFFIEDNGDLTMNLGLVTPGTAIPLVVSLFTSGKFNLKPIGVHINAYITQSQPGPMFAFDMNSGNFAGFDTGAFATFLYN